MVWMNHIDVLLLNELNVFVVTMATVAMETMATMEISNFFLLKITILALAPSPHNTYHQMFSLIFVYIGVSYLATRGVF